MKIKRIIDISRKLYNGMNTWPGDTKYKTSRQFSINDGNLANLSSLEFSAHTGSHVDAPLHFVNGGKDISALDLNRFFCFVKVYEIIAVNCITEEALKELDIKEGDSIIFKTSNSLLPEEEPLSEKYVFIDIPAARYLVSKKVRLIGIDNLTVDAFDSKEFPVHKLFLANNVGIIEGLRLEGVNEGIYLLSALPLKLEGLDGSPVRAVLVEIE